MACDPVTQRRRKRHEYDETWNASCRQQLGMLNGFGLSSQLLLHQVDQQNDPKWEWLEGEKILTYLEPGLFLADYGFYWQSPDEVHQIFLRFSGTNNVTGDNPSNFRTNSARLEIINFQVFPSIKIDVEDGFLYRLKPSAFDNVQCTITNQIAPNPFGNPTANGTFTFVPLKKCHDCVDIP